MVNPASNTGSLTELNKTRQHRHSHKTPNIETDGVDLVSSIYYPPRRSLWERCEQWEKDDVQGGRGTDSVGIKIVSALIQELRIECSLLEWIQEKDSHKPPPSFFFPQFCEIAVVATLTCMIHSAAMAIVPRNICCRNWLNHSIDNSKITMLNYFNNYFLITI